MRFALENETSGRIKVNLSSTVGNPWRLKCYKIMLEYQPKTTAFVVERLIAMYPEAAEAVDIHGRLQLHYLSTTPGCFEHPESLFSLIDAKPAAMDICDPNAGLLPLQSMLLAATSATPDPEKHSMWLTCFSAS
jgi:hypothetical protein